MQIHKENRKCTKAPKLEKNVAKFFGQSILKIILKFCAEWCLKPKIIWGLFITFRNFQKNRGEMFGLVIFKIVFAANSYIVYL